VKYRTFGADLRSFRILIAFFEDFRGQNIMEKVVGVGRALKELTNESNIYFRNIQQDLNLKYTKLFILVFMMELLFET